MRFYPALLSDSIEVIDQQLQIAQSIPQVQTVQVDILDGLFADNLTVFPSELTDLNFGNLKLDLHLMVEEPIDFVHETLSYASSLPIRAYIAQVEKMSFQDQFVEEVKKTKSLAGLSLDIFSPLEAIDEKVLPHLDCIQLMAIEAGFQGQQLSELVYQKIKDLKKILQTNNLKIEIIVDGGVKLNNLLELKKAGVDSVAVGSMLWSASNPSVIAKEIDMV